MKIKLFLLSLLLWFGALQSQTITIDLSTGKNDDGTLMNAPPPDVAGGASVMDPDWTVMRPGETVQVSTKTRHTYSGWSFPGLGVTGNALQSRWITDKDGLFNVGDGYYYYYSKTFTIPSGTTDATLNLRSLSFVRNWTYLVRTDVSPNTEELIVQTTWMSDGAKGWLNSRSPEVINKPITPGTYIIKVKLYTNNGGVTNAVNVHGLVSYTPQTCATPAPSVSTPIAYCQNTTASPLSATGTALLWYNAATGGTGSTTAPTPSTSSTGTTSYYVSQTLNGCEGPREKIDVTINAGPVSPAVNTPVTYCQNAAASPLSATGTGLLWYTTATRGSGSTIAPTPSTNSTGTTSYYVSQTINGCESTRSLIDVVVSSTLGLPGVNSQITYCQNETASSLSATGTGLLWYTTGTGGTGSTTAPIPSTNVAGSTDYWVSQSVNSCEGLRAKITVTVNAGPNTPATGVITQPSCSVSTGSVILSGLPAGNWTIIANPGGATLTGNTSTATFTNLSPGTSYYFNVKTATGCTSVLSDEVVINSISGITGNDKVCKGSSITLLVPSSIQGAGTNPWSLNSAISGVTLIKDANNPNVATMTVAASVTAASAIVRFTTTTGCVLTKTVSIGTVVTPTFSTPAIPSSICFGQNYTLPTTASNTVMVNGVATPITGTWSPAIVDNMVKGIYTFTPNQLQGYCINSTSVTISVSNSLERYSGDAYQTVNAGTPIQKILYRIVGGTTATVAGLPTGVTYSVVAGMGNIGKDIKISGTPTTPGTYNFTVTVPNASCSATATGKIVVNPTGTVDWTLAPNSYIFTGKDDKDPTKDVDGIKIPVKKAFAVWKDDRDPVVSFNTPVPAGSQLSAYVYWEDVSGIIKSDASYKLNLDGSGEDAKILVPVNKAKGEGNAVIALHAGSNGNSSDPIYWSWHVWITDDPRINGSAYNQGFEKDKNGVNAFADWKWMDRNLGATNAQFLGNDWNKSAGLMYQWGRKDAIPPMTYKDGTSYEIHGEIGKGRKFNPFAPVGSDKFEFGWKLRPNNAVTLNNHSEVAQNLKYAVNHPLQLITYTNFLGETWFSDQEYRVTGFMDGAYYSNRISWDLWSDNRNGMFSQQGHTYKVGTTNVITEVGLDSQIYKLKSSYDPCPCGWRIPSHYGGSLGGGTGNNNSSPWGRGGGGNDDAYNDYTTAFVLSPSVNEGKPFSYISLKTNNSMLSNIKVYPSLGFDFSGQSNRKLDYFPLTGAYVYFGPQEKVDYYRASEGVSYVNWLATAGFPTSTYSPWNGIRGMGIVADYKTTPDKLNLSYSIAQTSRIKGAGTVRCIKDPNDTYMPSVFKTDYIYPSASAQYTVENLKSWSKEPNSYIIAPADVSKTFSIKKAVAMHKLYLTDNADFPADLSVSVYWTTKDNNIDPINAVYSAGSNPEDGNITINRTAGQYGNAVVALHNGTAQSSPVIWSWHIWLPETEPVGIEEYLTEIPYDITANSTASGISPSGHVINNSYSLVLPPLKTVFMDRNLGALKAFPTTATSIDDNEYKKTIGLHYQFGRKDPLPSFLDGNIYRNGQLIGAAQYNSTTGGYISNYSQYAGNVTSTNKREFAVKKVLKYSAENPLTYLNQDITKTGTLGGASYEKPKDWISEDQGIAFERWGHAGEKSPFDPCPEGWRVPDNSYSFASSYTGDGVKGNSPWYLGGKAITDPNPNSVSKIGIGQTYKASAENDYKGVLVNSALGNHAGWVFNGNNNGKSYKIGNYPLAGVRTGSSVVANEVGVWSASMDDAMFGNALGLRIKSGLMTTGIGMNPYSAMSCRCAKDEPRYLGIPVTNNSGVQARTILASEEVQQKVKSEKLVLYPIPVSSILYISANDNKDYYYEVYNMSGQLVKKGKFENKQTDVSGLISGAYLVRINDSDAVVKIIKK
ncbi:T9SS type A sorting domain-containing protein [Chryseobacterium formosus]|uniref:T9SS type A sorting domain-containing protein n=1 Tax=Chryseobacterium formosus TaxID=1537363 RepID=A0ABT3XVM8_9FLAO|nr:T9SS type A sorting domain-containing protein [Chryseobacterium formosus]MCX8525681.1 T9SS type A sorting domain-containing protein [Chryseobacterium formosus]